MSLAGKTVLVTGASRGIGATLAEEFARAGARVVLSARTAGVIALAGKLRAAGHAAEALAGDVADDAHVKALAQLCRAKFGGLDVLVNNAGVLVPGRLGMVRLDDVRRMFEVNVLAALNLTQYAIRLFPKGKGGAIVNLASIAGTQGADGLAAYGASKAAIVGFTRAAAKELAAQKIRVNAVAPGFVETDMTRQFAPEVVERTVAGIRLGRIGQPADVARAVLFLASDDAAYITGQVLGVDGGMSV
ncbi:MAG TPA: SDR family NAD(P)-dependent oxidoreductase [Opitutaceae bacterium]|nr:SDR family NAD(P)-dependent oxidoreductase [Opitutaceae bacterium]